MPAKSNKSPGNYDLAKENYAKAKRHFSKLTGEHISSCAVIPDAGKRGHFKIRLDFRASSEGKIAAMQETLPKEYNGVPCVITFQGGPTSLL